MTALYKVRKADQARYVDKLWVRQVWDKAIYDLIQEKLWNFKGAWIKVGIQYFRQFLKSVEVQCFKFSRSS